MPEYLIYMFLCTAGFFAGFIDSIAGGGGLITTPALLAVGIPPHIALGTNKFQSMFGTSFGLANFARKSKVIWKIAVIGIPFALIGSAFGAKLVLFIPQDSLAKLIILILPPLAVFIIFSKFFVKFHKEPSLSFLRTILTTAPACFFVGAYDGFLGPGTGTFLIIALVIFSHIPLLNATATAKTFNLASNVGAFVVFVWSGNVYYKYGIAMAIFNIFGNLLGSHFAMKHDTAIIKKVLIVSLSLLFVYLMWKYF